MEKIVNWWNAHKPTKRRLIQLYAALLTNANLKGFSTGQIYKGDVKAACVPGLNCYSCPGASAACPLGALQNALAGSGVKAPYYVLGILLLYGILFGRWICGFLCPFGLIQDLLYKIKTPKLKKNKVTRALSWLKYIILAVLVFGMPLYYGLQKVTLPAFCKYICPSGTLLGAVGLLSTGKNDAMFGSLGPLFTWKFCLLVVIIVACIFIYRAFCRFLCPLGALYGLFNKFAILGIRLDTPKCVNCGLCTGKCKMDIRHVGDKECISCGDCISVCPTKAISFKGPKILLAPNEVGEKNATPPKKTKVARIVVAAVMAAVLAGALIYFNIVDREEIPQPSVTPQQTDPDNPVIHGNQPGNLCYSVDLKLLAQDGTFSIEETRGKVTVLNFWGTWCPGCVEELTADDEHTGSFVQMARHYGDQIQIVTIHSGYMDPLYPDEESVLGFTEEKMAGLPYLHCIDDGSESYCTMLGGGSQWPHTVILDENGIIVAAINSTLSFDQLQEILDPLLAE